MTIQPKVAFCINVDGSPRSLFTVYEQNDGELILTIKSGETIGLQEGGKKILQQRYSIHLNQNSPDYNVIKQTITVEGEEIATVALTDAIKKASGFAHIYSRRFPNPSGGDIKHPRTQQ